MAWRTSGGRVYAAVMPEDARGRLVGTPFSYRIAKDGKVLVSRAGRLVTILSGARALRLAAGIEAAAGEAQVQQLLARATGNYRRGNERAGRAGS
jgi:hypothetical protein